MTPELLSNGQGPNPDVELIRLCTDYIAAVAAYNRSSPARFDGDPLWEDCERIQAAIDALPPKTIAGVLAKARVARAEAREASAEGGELWEGSAAPWWARDVVNDLLRLCDAPSVVEAV